MRRILPILSLILLIALHSGAQSLRTSPAQESGDKIIKLYPNPATSYVTFEVQNGSYKKGLTIYIFNGVLGKKMYEAVNIQEKTTVSLNDFTRGVYIYHLIDETGRIIESGKFQVSR